MTDEWTSDMLKQMGFKALQYDSITYANLTIDLNNIDIDTVEILYEDETYGIEIRDGKPEVVTDD